MKRTDRVKTAVDYLLILSGAAIYALSVDFFTAPNDIAPGGITGISTMLNHLFLTPIGGVSLILNIPLFIWGALENGARFMARTVIAVALVAVFIDVISLFEISYNGDRITASIFGGILSGTGLGLIFLRGGSTGGTDIIARNLNKRFPFISIGSIVLISDAVVVALSAIVYGKLENALYAVIAIFASSKLIDAVVFGFSRDNGKLLIIISSVYSEVSDIITTKEDKGVTLIKASGGFSKADLGVILCAVHPRDAYRIKASVLSADAHAFIITTTATAISGLGFTNFT